MRRNFFGDHYVNTGSRATFGAASGVEHDTSGYAICNRSLIIRQRIIFERFHSGIVHGEH